MRKKKHLTPKEIVFELDRYIIGQAKAKRAVAIALRNRWRRQQLPPELKDDVAPKNIIMIGSTGIGKTEIARRLARLASAPFIKVEASKYTEVGYVGRDVESMIRDLVEVSMKMTHEEKAAAVREQAERLAEEKILDLLLPGNRPAPIEVNEQGEALEPRFRTRDKFRALLREGKLDERLVEVEVTQNNAGMIEVFSNTGMEEMGVNFQNILGNMFPSRKQTRRIPVQEAKKLLTEEESNSLIDMEKTIREALEKVESEGIVFLDEIDKIAGRESRQGPDVSREGVQRDILPIVEGCNVNTKYGMVKTDHILFIAAGAFHVAKPSDLIPELQGRFPIRVRLNSLTKKDFIAILTEPQNALLKQYRALLGAEKVDLSFDDEAIDKIAAIAVEINELTEDIGARRLHTVLEKLLEEISFNATDLPGTKIVIDKKYVDKRLHIDEIIKDGELKLKREVGFSGVTDEDNK